MNNLIIEKNESGLVTVFLNRPEKRNSFHASMILEIKETFESFARDSSVSLVWVKGKGQSFCSGADLSYMKDMASFSFAENKKDSEKLFDMFFAIKNCPCPVISQVQGHVFGGGLGIVAASDFSFAEEQTKFCFSETKMGLAPAVISPFVLERMRKGPARELMLSAEVFSAEEAEKYGLISHVVSGEVALEKVSEAKANELLKLGPEALKATKKHLLMLGTDLSQYRESCCELISERRGSREGQEGLAAFFEKRAPKFKRGQG